MAAIDSTHSRPLAGILFILAGMVAISFNDLLIKQLSGGYPLHEMVFVRSGIGILFSLLLVQVEGGWHVLKTPRPGLHALRGLVVVFANMTYFAALAVLPLGEATALYFVAPLFITLLSIPLLGESVGPWRFGAVLAGLAGVAIMQRPWASDTELHVSRLVLLLPVISAFAYAVNQILTRKIGFTSKASAMAVYIQLAFLVVSALFWLVAGDGRFAEGVESGSLVFLLRAWTMPEGVDRWLFLALGCNSACVAYCLSQAYRSANAAVVAPFEYVGLPLAILWGWVFFAEVPQPVVWLGIALILGGGVVVFIRERMRNRPVATARRVNRRY